MDHPSCRFKGSLWTSGLYIHFWGLIAKLDFLINSCFLGLAIYIALLTFKIINKYSIFKYTSSLLRLFIFNHFLWIHNGFTNQHPCLMYHRAAEQYMFRSVTQCTRQFSLERKKSDTALVLLSFAHLVFYLFYFLQNSMRMKTFGDDDDDDDSSNQYVSKYHILL